MRIKQEWLVLVLILGGLLGVASVFSIRTGRSHQEAMVAALKGGLERLYDEAVSRNASTNIQVSSYLLADVLLAPGSKLFSIVPGMVSTSSVFLPKDGVVIPSSNLVCAVKMDSGHIFAIDGNRRCREVSGLELRNWRHKPLAAMSP